MRHRDPSGRFIVAPPPPLELPDPVLFPTDRHPRWRLVVFDRRWPWRATRLEVRDDALASGNATKDAGDRTYLTVPAMVQRDPPDQIDLENALRRRAIARAEAEVSRRYG